uniref:Uncharacterized protein n=1 Tax=Ascaris lumbricoides TaxID=6252 RepID=A0A9J2P880_ASCLU
MEMRDSYRMARSWSGTLHAEKIKPEATLGYPAVTKKYRWNTNCWLYFTSDYASGLYHKGYKLATFKKGLKS